MTRLTSTARTFAIVSPSGLSATTDGRVSAAGDSCNRFLDLDEPSIERASSAEVWDNVEIVVGDVVTQPFESSSFDLTSAEPVAGCELRRRTLRRYTVTWVEPAG